MSLRRAVQEGACLWASVSTDMCWLCSGCYLCFSHQVVRGDSLGSAVVQNRGIVAGSDLRSCPLVATAWTDVTQPVCTGPWLCREPTRCHEPQAATRASWADATPSCRLPCLLWRPTPHHATSAPAAAPTWTRTSSANPTVWKQTLRLGFPWRRSLWVFAD